ncbi:MAG: DUF3524 domain-containing protein [Oleiphilaceae bacterium]|nr:DUF3524 domain-containing protein [Oleiphilaceae bacterium]
MRILLLSAYDADSHRYWHQSLTHAFGDAHWQVLTLPPRHFAWRVRGNSLTWAHTARDVLEDDYDLLIATSMCDLSALRGMVPQLATLPTLLYFHENQFAYPPNASKHGNLEPQVLSLYSAVCADQLVFNSHYNRNTFFEGASALLQKLPDGVPADLLPLLRNKSRVIPVPLETLPPRIHQAQHTTTAPLNIVWNHRWEYDKGPDLLRDIVQHLLHLKVEFRLHVVGQQFRATPSAFAQIQSLAAARIGHWGYVPSRQAYLALLQSADVVLSTALHDFQGLSVLEAVASGCVPVVPHRLVYPEWFGPDWCYGGAQNREENSEENTKDSTKQSQAAAQRLASLAQQKAHGTLPEPPSVTHLQWPHLRADYAKLFAELMQPIRD